jgi:hypothetical protein
MVFMASLAGALAQDLPAAGQVVDAQWPSALLGSQAPDAWYFIPGAKRPDLHLVDVDDPQTWPEALERWLERYPTLAPGKQQPPETAAFVIGYLSHLGLDVWAEQYQHPDLPASARQAAPHTWFPPALADRRRLQAALRALTEAPMPPERILSPQQLEAAPVPAGFPEAEIKRVAGGVAPGLPLRDPWAISRVNPLRAMPDTAEERARWEQQRADLPDASDAEYQALLDGAADFTLAVIRRWW